jgi:DNA polymerase-3 subunit epsilon
VNDRRLRLTRPLVFMDLESTGVDPRNDRIVELSLLKMFPPGEDGLAQEPIVRTRRINPTVPIPPGATLIHGITDADVAAEPPFEQVAQSLFDLLQDCDFAGFGVRRYDLPLLRHEFKRAGLDFEWQSRHVIDGKDIFHFKEPRTLTAAYALYCKGELKSAHSAEADMLASRDVLFAQLEHYDDLPLEVAELAGVGAPQADPDAFDHEGKLRWIAGEGTSNFGKSRGRTLRELAAGERGILEWILRSDFSDEVRTCVRNALAGRFPVRE